MSQVAVFSFFTLRGEGWDEGISTLSILGLSLEANYKVQVVAI
jgi:hypothetical protein